MWLACMVLEQLDEETGKTREGLNNSNSSNSNRSYGFNYENMKIFSVIPPSIMLR